MNRYEIIYIIMKLIDIWIDILLGYFLSSPYMNSQDHPFKKDQIFSFSCNWHNLLKTVPHFDQFV